MGISHVKLYSNYPYLKFLPFSLQLLNGHQINNTLPSVHGVEVEMFIGINVCMHIERFTRIQACCQTIILVLK